MADFEYFRADVYKRQSGVLLVNKADKNLLRLKDTNEKKYVTASGNVYSNMISKLPCVLDGLSLSLIHI